MQSSAINLPTEIHPVTGLFPVGVDQTLLTKLLNSPYAYVRADNCCGLCKETFRVYVSPSKVTNYSALNDLVYRGRVEGCCLCCCPKLYFYPPNTKVTQFFFDRPCCDECCKSKCCDCYVYSDPLIGYYGGNKNNRIGHYRTRYCCITGICAHLNPATTIVYSDKGHPTFEDRIDCCDTFNPCLTCCEVNFPIYKYNTDQVVGNFKRSAKKCCGTYDFEIEFRNDATIEEKIIFIASCCAQA